MPMNPIAMPVMSVCINASFEYVHGRHRHVGHRRGRGGCCPPPAYSRSPIFQFRLGVIASGTLPLAQNSFVNSLFLLTQVGYATKNQRAYSQNRCGNQILFEQANTSL